MKKLFYLGLLGLLAFELLNVYFIMPLPGSQRMNSISLAYFLYSWRWVFRGLFGAMMVWGFLKAQWKRRWLVLIPVLSIAGAIYFINFRMSADHMFYQPRQLTFANVANNKVDSQRLVIGLEINGVAKAYPIQFIGFHHIVPDTLGGKQVLVTYCTVCRTGRVFDPVVDGKPEIFRLVGMDHFNAMFEDATTGSWWRQATGEAVTGKMKGRHLDEIFSEQATLADWVKLHPATLIMQEDPSLQHYYSRTFDYETGKSKSKLTGTDTAAWQDKSWVIGVRAGDKFMAYDWNLLKAQRVITSRVGEKNVMLVLAKDNATFSAFEIASMSSPSLNDDIITINGHRYNIDGQGVDTSGRLTRIAAYQEFWHSWHTFHPSTEQYR